MADVHQDITFQNQQRRQPQQDPMQLLLSQLGFGGVGLGLNLIGGLLGGDGGQRGRIREAQGVGRELFGARFDPGAIAQQRGAFQQGILSPFLNRQAQTASRRVGLGSGIGQQFILNRGQDLSAGFESEAIMRELDRVLRQRLAGANITAGLAR